MTQQDQAEVLHYLNQFGATFNQISQEMIKRLLSHQMPAHLNPFFSPSSKAQPMTSPVTIDARSFLRQQFEFLEKQQRLWQNASRALMGEMSEDLIRETAGDKRFSDPDWQGNPAFNYLKQAYLLNAEYVQQMADALDFEDAKFGEQVRFYTRQLVNSMAPTNYVFTNPEVCREILKSEGECLARGIDKFMRDLENSPSEAFKITQVDMHAFRLGVDLAATPGKVIYRNHLIELLHYTPTTEHQHSVPLLIVPPFINKYYILDLDRKKSLVRWLLDQGFNVFMVSWVNPDGSYRDINFDDYLFDGVLVALDAVQKVAKTDHVNAAGYCVGGTLLGMAQAYMAARGDPRLASLTLLTTLFDFSEPGEVGNYMNGQMLPMIENSVSAKGYLDGRILALSFSLLRENNLFWSFFIENYLKGRDPMPFDILYWNSDSTNLPGAAYLFYLNKMYIENSLCQPGSVVLGNTGLDLSQIRIPTYCLAAQTDHIVLWQAAYRSAQLLGGEVRFVLTESGHVAGVVNPAGTGKYGHWINPNVGTAPDEWLKQAELVPGSWWLDWQRWLMERSGDQVPAQFSASPDFPPLEDAPGRYVKVRLERGFAEAPASETCAT
jgi:polyhydroxyalkanoate synthase